MQQYLFALKSYWYTFWYVTYRMLESTYTLMTFNKKSLFNFYGKWYRNESYYIQPFTLYWLRYCIVYDISIRIKSLNLKLPDNFESLVGTIQWDFGSPECVQLLYWNYYSRGNFVRGIFCAYQNFEKWPLGVQNADFMLFKLNNRLVNRRPSPNPAFLLYFWKVHGMTNPNQLKDLVAVSCLLDLRLLENIVYIINIFIE